MHNIITLDKNNKKLAFYWLIQSVGALALSGFFAIFLVVARSPIIGKLLPYKDFFKTCLTIHVNLSVLIWLTSFCCLLFSLNTKLIKLGYTSLIMCAMGSIMISLSIFDFSAEAYLNNYIPMLNSKIFLYGIYLYFAGFFIASFQALICNNNDKFYKYFNLSSFFIILSSFLTLWLTRVNLNLPEVVNLYNFADYYERLFWGFGHILQFLYVNCLIFALFFIASELSFKPENNFIKNSKCGILILNLILASSGIYIINFHDVTTYEYIQNYTKQMVLFGGVAASVSALIIIPKYLKNHKIFSLNTPARNAALWSMVLFGAGGIISMFINGVNTIIPAHYHGSIVGVSLSLMGLCYILLSKIDLSFSQSKIANMQSGFYGLGQLIHIIGFALSGGYGALRKAPGVELAPEAKIYMGLMGMGGLISIIGGIMFVLIIFKVIISHYKKN